jgi:hypothetical protein
MILRMPGLGPLDAAGSTEGTDEGSDILMLGVYGVVEAADVSGGELTGEIGEGGTKLGKSRESGLTDDGDGVIRREVVAVVFKGHKSEGINEAIGGVARDDVYLMIDESAIDKAEVHDFGRSREIEIVALAPTAEAIRTLEKFVADPDAPSGCEGREVGDFLEMQISSVVAADDHGESVFEAEGLGDFEMEALGVELFNAMVNSVRIALRSLVEDGRESGAGILDVKIELTGFEGFVDEEGAAEIRLPINRYARFGFNVLGEKFGKNDLLGEELGTDSDFGAAGCTAGGSKHCRQK